MKKLQVIYDSQIFDLQRYGGISRYFCEIISRMHMRYDITVRYTQNHYLMQTQIGKHRWHIPDFIFKRYEQKLYKQNQKLTKKTLKASTPYIFHPTYYDGYFLKYIGSNPFIVTVHDMIYERFPNLFSGSEDTIRQKQEIITKATRIIAISENTKKDIIEFLNIDPHKIDVIYHGTSMQAPVGEPKLILPKRYILFVGDRSSYKNFHRLIAAFAIIRQADKELHLVCTGKPFTEEELQQLKELNISSHTIQISVEDSHLNELYNRAMLFVYPSLYEGFGIPILEAYACHCPVALSKSSCFPEIAGDASAFFDPYSVENMAKIIMSTINSEEERLRLIQAGKERLKFYSWEKAVRETEEVYQKVLDNLPK